MKASLMIVDDIPYIRKLIKELLASEGIHIVGEASDGGEAIALYEKLKPEIVLMDAVLPKVSGIDATRQILKTNPEAKIIVVSGLESEFVVMEAISAGAKDFVLKPFKKSDLLKSISHVYHLGEALTH